MLTVIKTSRNRIILSAFPVTRVFLSFSTGSSLGTESVVAQDTFESNHEDAKKSSNKKDNGQNELKSNLRPCVDQIIRDLVDISMNLTKKQQTEKLKEQAEALVLERLVDILSGPNVSFSFIPSIFFYLIFFVM